MHLVYLSPHFDDAAMSCGGLIWEQSRQGHRVEIWTICAGDPPPGPYSAFTDELHARWRAPEDAVTLRREEDAAACQIMGAGGNYFPVPDCIYRRALLNEESEAGHPIFAATGPFLYPDQEAIFGLLHPAEATLAAWVRAELHRKLAERSAEEVQLVIPLSVGGHVDHQLTRQAAEGLGTLLWYYADYPYAGKPEAEKQIHRLEPGTHRLKRYPLSADGQLAWGRSIAAYESQISTFWGDISQMQLEIDKFHDASGGIRLWQPITIQER